MSRPSKLTPVQWKEVEKRFLCGETSRSLGREYGVSEAGIRKKYGAHQKVSAQGAQVRTVAEKLAEAEIALQALPAVHRHVAIDLAEKLRNISQSVAAAAELGAKTGHRLHALANAEVCRVDDADVLSEDSMEALKGVGVLTKLANESLAPALTLINATKGQMAGNDEQPANSHLEATDDALLAIACKS